MTIWVLGDQLSRTHGPLADVDPETDRVLMIEATAFADRHPYHAQKLALVFAAMRHVRDELREEGITVDYQRAETFGEGLDSHFEHHPGDALTVVEPASYGAGERLEAMVDDRGGSLECVPDPTFLCSPEGFDEWLDSDGDAPTDVGDVRHEDFYRWMRRRTGYLMNGDEPVGEAWNFDDENRAFPRPEYDFPEPPAFEPDELTRETLAWVEDEFDAWGNLEPFEWPVTRTQALAARDDFIEQRLPEFGPYQDAIVGRSWAGNHALLSPALNLGLLHPTELIEPAITAYQDGHAPLPSVEGFVRQILGWREFVRQIYRRRMPAMAEANQLEATRDLPPLYWDGNTEMACLETVVDRVRRRGYSHHIERLMVLSNFGLLYGVDPAALNHWFHATYVDAYHWVTTPNVVGMGVFGSDALATKPYAASANYLDRMSDCCGDCRFDPDETTGEDACPFNALYWDFLERNADRLQSNHRMGLVYHHLENKADDERASIRERATAVRERVADGEL